MEDILKGCGGGVRAETAHERDQREMTAEKAHGNNKCPAEPHPVDTCGQAETTGRLGGCYEVPINELKLKELYYRQHKLQKEAQQVARAIDIIHRHPEFMECIELMRSGLI